MKLSIAMSTFNAGPYLDGQLASLVQQTRHPDEVVVRDDASTDATLPALEAFARDAPFPVRIERGETRLGSIRSFARAIAACSGDVVLLADQDDMWDPQKIARVEGAFSRSARALMVCSDAQIVDGQGRVISPSAWRTLGFEPEARQTTGPALLRFLLGRAVLAGCTLAFRTEARQLVLPFPEELVDPDETMHHDRWISLVLAAVGEVVLIDEPLLAYRIHDEQQLGITMLRLRHVVPTRLWGLAGLAASREQRRARLVSRQRQYAVLRDRLAAPGAAAADALEEIAGYGRYLSRRIDFASTRRRRAVGVAREWRSGTYRRYGFGASTAFVDVVR